MRKSQKQELLSIVKKLHSFHQEMRKKIEKEEFLVVQAELRDCQNIAIQIGETIEQIEGEGTEAVSHLEQYCERIYQVSIQLGEISAQKAYKKLEEMLIKIENAIRNMKVKKVAAFLPYKASMWDSMESVWKPASEDTEWETFVIPIPYYSKNEGGMLGEMRYEGADFPKDVPITNWQWYSLENEHPDIIFIHNPYDEYNYVTTVHPHFYSSKIRNFTDKLVYIPYFVHQNDIVKDIYCVQPGTVYADIVILQSEKVREQYIRYYLEALAQPVEELQKKEVEKKFQALGSPKFDNNIVRNTELPEEWKEFLVTESGDENKKNVVFFNTHLSSIMPNKSEKFLQKLRRVFNFFRKREDVLLLWRPHPLMVDTAQSMNPQALAPYLELVDKYKQEKIGIYDDSKDLHRAMALSDAYYGDRSSVAELFRQQGKPILIMDHSAIED